MRGPSQHFSSLPPHDKRLLPLFESLRYVSTDSDVVEKELMSNIVQTINWGSCNVQVIIICSAWWAVSLAVPLVVSSLSLIAHVDTFVML